MAYFDSNPAMNVDYRLPAPLNGEKGDMWSKRNANVLNYQIWNEQKMFNWAAMMQQFDFNSREREAAQQYNTSERLAAQDYNTSEREAAQQYNTSEREAAQQFNLDMWNRSNEYNSPAAQAARFRAAGINPALAINGAGSAAPIQSSPASVSPASSSPGSVSPASGSAASIGGGPQMTSDPYGFNEILGSTSRVLDSIENALGQHEQIKGLRIDNETRAARNQSEIENLIAQKRKVLADANVSEAEKDRVRAEITGLRIQNYRNAFAASNDKKHESNYDLEFDKRMRALDNENKESQLRVQTQHLVNFLNVRKDLREEKALTSALAVARANIEKMASEKGYIDKQAATEEVRKQLVEAQEKTEKENGRLTQNQADMADTERRDKNFDYNRKIDSYADMLRSDTEKHLDHFIYYVGEAAGVPIKGIVK